MKKLGTKIFFSVTFIALFWQQKIFSQTIEQDPKIEVLLKEKRKINTPTSFTEKYKIQIFNGTNEDAKKILLEFRKLYKDTDGTIIYNNPTYKVWVGKFDTRIEAEKLFADIKKLYPNALLIKPTK